MGKNVYAAPRKGPAGKWVEPSDKKPIYLVRYRKPASISGFLMRMMYVVFS